MSAQRKAALEPDSFDIYDQCFHNLDIVWFWRAIQPIELDRIERWDEVSDLTKHGRISPLASLGPRREPAKTSSTCSPTCRSARGPRRASACCRRCTTSTPSPIRRELFPGRPPEEASWAWLFDPEVRGRLVLVDEPGIGVFDAALAFEARGDIRFADIGNMTVAEIDALMALLWARGRRAIFASLWRTAAQSAAGMMSGQAGIGSMWSPGDRGRAAGRTHPGRGRAQARVTAPGTAACACRPA